MKQTEKKKKQEIQGTEEKGTEDRREEKGTESAEKTSLLLSPSKTRIL